MPSNGDLNRIKEKVYTSAREEKKSLSIQHLNQYTRLSPLLVIYILII